MASNREYQRSTMNKLREACIEGKMHQVHKYMPIVKQRSFPFKVLERTHKPLVYLTTVHGQLEVLKELIEMYGCDPHYKTERGDTLLYLACARGHSPVVRYLALVHKIDPNQQNKFKVSPLVAASNNGRLDTMVILIDEFKCDPMAVTEKGESLLHKASDNGHLVVVKCLISKYGFNPEIRSGFNETPLHFACGSGHLPVARYLIEEHKCDTNAVNDSYSTPLHSACRNGHTEVVRYLVFDVQGCDVSLEESSGNNPFHLACRYQRNDVVRVLLDSGKVDPNLPNLSGDVPIKLARNQDTIKCLVERGAKPIGKMIDVLTELPQDERLVQTFLIGSSPDEKENLAQTLQVLASENPTITYYNPCNCGKNINLKIQNHQLLIHDYVGQPDFLKHSVIHATSSSLSTLLFMVILNLKDELEELKRSIDHWLSFLREQRPPGITNPHVLVIGSHNDDALRRKHQKKFSHLVSAIKNHVKSRLQSPRLYYDGLIAINYKDTKCQGELHKQLKRSCNALQRDHFDTCGDILNIFLIKEFKGKVSCTLADIIEKACSTFKAYTLGSNMVTHLHQLTESLSEQNKVMFLPNSANPEKSLIIFDADALINTFSRQLLTSQQLSGIELSHMTDLSEIPWSQIQQYLPDLDLDPSSVASYLNSLGYQPTSRGTLRLSYGDDTRSESTAAGSYMLSKAKWPSSDSGISSVSCLTTSNDTFNLIKQDSLFLHLHSRNFSERDVSSEPSLISKSESDSTHFGTKHNIDAIQETSNADVYHETKGCLSTQSKVTKYSNNKCSPSKNCCIPQDSDTYGVTKGSITQRKRGFHFCHNSQHMINQYLHCFQNIASVPFQGHITVVECDDSGGEYKNMDHDITLSIPEGAVPRGEIVHMEVAVALYGPFHFSDGKRPISPILWLCAQENVILIKPISIVLPHMLVNLTQEDVTNFGIELVKADHREYITTLEGKRKYIFRPHSAALELTSIQERDYIAIKTDHFCFICLEMNKLGSTSPEIARQMAVKMGYYLHCIESLQSPYLVSPPREIIHFCVSFFLETCRKAVEEQFPLCNSNGELIHRIHAPQRFTMKQSCQYLRLKHSTNFEKADVVTVAVSKNGKICVSSVDFWESQFEEDLLKLLHKEKQYPPRLEMTVQLKALDETVRVILTADFDGCVDDHTSPTFQLILPIGHKPEIRRPLESEPVLSSYEKTGHGSPSSPLARDYGWKRTSSNLPHKNDKPTLSQLYCLTSGCMNIRVIKTIAPKWIELAMAIGYEHSDIELVNVTTQRDPLNAVRHILGQWLDGSESSCGPATWSTLIEHLSTMEYQCLADRLNDVLLD